MGERKVVLVQVFDLEESTAYFHSPELEFQPGERCVVDHEGQRLGVVQDVLSAGEELSEHLERIVRRATPDDLHRFSKNLEDADEAISTTRTIVDRYELPMHLVDAEYTLDRTKLRIYFTAPHRVDFRELLRELAATFKIRIELRQIGTRDEARIKGGIGQCGRIVCCHQHLKEPKPVPMDLAYDQELFVSPERITGLCGRLMCCLHYEHKLYKERLRQMPKLGNWVEYRGKKAKVVSHNIFLNTITVQTEDQERVDVDADSVRKAASPHSSDD